MEQPDPAPVLDLEVVEALKDLDDGDGSNLFLELIDLFVEDAALQLEALLGSLERGDAGQLERSAHTLKSSCANIGAQRMSELCFELEKLGRAGTLASADGLVQRAREAYQQVCEALAGMR